jgi:hypothetical protein
MKAIMVAETLLRYPDHNIPFEIEADASDYQLSSVVKQNGQPVVYYSRKLNGAQRNYTTIEKELLSIVETFKTYRNMLLGAQINVKTNHRNLTHELGAFSTQRVLHWRLYLEEFSPTFEYIKGENNVTADALSRLPHSPSLEGENIGPTATSHSAFIIEIDNEEILQCFLLYTHSSIMGTTILSTTE